MSPPRLMNGLLAQASVMLIYSLALLRLPLFNELGYEFSVAIALAVPILNWRVIRKAVRRAPIEGQFSAGSIRALFASTQLQSLSILCIPFIASMLNLVVVKNCSFLEGVAFFILIPVITSFWINGVIFLCRAAFRRPLPWYIGILCAVFGYSAYLGYATPQIHSYNFIYGFFGGLSYDETLTISLPLLLFRFLTMYCAFALYCTAEYFVRRRVPAAHSPAPSLTVRPWTLVLIILPLIASWMVRIHLGFESPADFIRKQLGSTYTTEHFQIHYAKSAFTEDEIRYAAVMHEFRLSQVDRALRTEFRGTIDSYIYPDAGTKRRFIGTGNTNIAKPWMREIHLNRESWESTLKHEIVHVVAGDFGLPVIRAHYNIGLVEGLAMAIDPEFGNKSLHEYAAAMLRFTLITDPGKLVRPAGFATHSSSVSYVMMGSFIKFLIDRYGVPRFREIYGGKSVARVYGIPIERLIEEWTHLLDAVEVHESWRRHVEFFFRRPSIFAKECAHAIANVNEEGYRQLGRNSPAAAMDAFSRGLAMSWNSESFSGLIRASYAAGRYDSLIALMDEQMQDTLHRSSFINLFLLYGDALWYREDFVSARSVYSELLAYDLSDRLDESAILRGMILQDRHLRINLADYVVGSLHDSSALRLLDTLATEGTRPLLRYLKAKLYLRLNRYREAVTELDTSFVHFENPFLNSRREQLLGESFFFLHEYQTARAHFWQSLNDVTSASTVGRVEDWIEKCEFFERKGE